MSVRNITPKILARAASAQDVAEMSAWKESDVLALAESALAAVVAEHASGTVCNRVIDALRAADGSPHYTAEHHDTQVAVYVLCLSSPASHAALSLQQVSWAESHPAADVWVLPCVVQHLRADAARCVVDSIYTVRTRGRWGADAAVRQFLPAADRTPHYLGGAALLKEHNLVREVANAGTRIYPYIAGVATHRHLPDSHELRCSGAGDFPLMLVQTRGARDGALRVVRAGIYSAENPVNELEIDSVLRDSVALMDARGHIYHAACAELSMFPDRLKVGMHLRWAVSIFADSFELCRKTRIRIDSAAVQVRAFASRIQAVKPVDFCGLKGYCLQAPVHEQLPGLLFNVYVFEHLLAGRVPRVGEWFIARGHTLAAPDSLVDAATCWADSPETAAASQADAAESVALQEYDALLPYGAPLAELVAAFVRAGYRMQESFLPLFRFGRPELRLLSPQGSLLLVMVDCVVHDHEDIYGYRCRFKPGQYPAHMNQTPQGDGPVDICFATLHLGPAPTAEADFSLKAELHGSAPLLDVSATVTLPPVPPLTEEDAAHLFADCMATQSFEKIIPHLCEDVQYHSETAGVALFSKSDLLRHLRTCFDAWKKRDVLKDIAFTVQQTPVDGQPRFTCLASQSGSPISRTFIAIKNNRIAEIKATVLH